MPRYFFHTHIDDDVIVDPEGRDLPDPDAAWAAARVLAQQLLQGTGSDPALFQAVLFVTDESEDVVLEFPLTDALVAEPVTAPDDETRH